MPKEQTFTFKECYTLLTINPKSFLDWLRKAGIDPDAQVDTFDPRKKYVTKSQLLQLAEAHGRVLPLLEDDEGASHQPITLEMLADQVAGIRELLAEVVQTMQQQPRPVVQEQVDYQPRFDRIDQAFEQMKVLVQERPQQELSTSQDKQDASTSREQPPMQEVPMPKALPVPDVPPSPSLPTPPKRTAPPSSPPAKTTSATKRGTKKKRTSKAKSFPRTLVPLRVVAKQHTIDMKVADRASESGKLPVVSGNWLYESRVVTKALDAAGQQDFYQVFHEREGFTRCEHCPHGFEGQDSPTEAEAAGIAG